MTESEHKWIETNKDACAVLRQLHDMLALSSLPPRRTWVGLTDEEVEASKPPLSNDAVVWELAVEWAEATLKEKNNG
jgi:hypothetical protein